MSIVNCLDISSDNQIMNNYVNAELGPVSSALAYNTKFELTDIIDNDRSLDALSHQDVLVDKMNKTHERFRTSQID